jgi:hypothetical protein
MRDSDDYDVFAINAVNESVWESSQKAAMNSWFDFWRGQGKGHNPPHDSVKLIEKLDAQSRSLFIVPENCVIELLLRQ